VEHLTQSKNSITGANKQSANSGSVLKDELETSMRLCGITDIDQAHPGLVNTRAVDHLVPSEQPHPYIRWQPKLKL
jgi:L-lactate dehydrogenase (cytochrome)